MDQAGMQDDSERDQLWASLRQLRPEIEALATGAFQGTDREYQLAQVLARVIAAELDFREREAEGQP